MKVFNTTGKCIPSMHYMVDISRQVEAAAKLVRRGNSILGEPHLSNHG